MRDDVANDSAGEDNESSHIPDRASTELSYSHNRTHALLNLQNGPLGLDETLSRLHNRKNHGNDFRDRSGNKHVVLDSLLNSGSLVEKAESSHHKHMLLEHVRIDDETPCDRQR